MLWKEITSGPILPLALQDQHTQQTVYQFML